MRGGGEGLHRESYLLSVFSLKLYIKFLRKKKYHIVGS